MIFGYKIINDFINRGEEVQFLQFKNDLEASIKKIYSEYGSVREETFRLPSGFDQICFVDFTSPYNQKLCEYDAVACNFWKSGGDYSSTAENVFLKPAAAQQIKVFMIHTTPAHEGEDGFLCVPIVQGNLMIRLEGKGDSTLVSLPES